MPIGHASAACPSTRGGLAPYVYRNRLKNCGLLRPREFKRLALCCKYLLPPGLSTYETQTRGSCPEFQGHQTLRGGLIWPERKYKKMEAPYRGFQVDFSVLPAEDQ